MNATLRVCVSVASRSFYSKLEIFRMDDVQIIGKHLDFYHPLHVGTGVKNIMQWDLRD